MSTLHTYCLHYSTLVCYLKLQHSFIFKARRPYEEVVLTL